MAFPHYPKRTMSTFLGSITKSVIRDFKSRSVSCTLFQSCNVFPKHEKMFRKTLHFEKLIYEIGAFCLALL